MTVVEDLIDRVDMILTILCEDEAQFYIVLELAHQLRDELTQISSEPEGDD